MMVHNLESASVLQFAGGYGTKILRLGMKELLDRYISTHYSEVKAYCFYFLSKMGSDMEADTVINNSYLHVLSINNSPKDINTVKAYLLNTIKYQILWSTSQSHRDDRVTALQPHGDEIEDTDDIDEKVRQDIQYNFNKSVIAIYRAEITDRIQQIVFEAYIDKGYITARSMATYFDITPTSAHNFIKEIKQNLTSIQYRYETITLF